MKVKSSRGIVMKLICCMAVVVVVSALAFSQTPRSTTLSIPTSGALLTIDGTGASSGVHVKLYDSQIHTGYVRTVPLATNLNGGNCNSVDQGFPTDAYVLQGGSGTGCDANDPFETDVTQMGSTTISGTGFSFSITAFYCITTPSGTEISCTSVGPGTGCNSAGTICASPDTGFLTVTNTSSTAFVGTISLTGTSPLCGAASDTTSGLGAGLSVTLALGTPGSPTMIDSSNCGGFNQSQTGTLTAGGSLTFLVGPDSYEIDGANNAGNESIKFSILPVLQSSTPPLPIGFQVGNVFPNDFCTPLASFSAPGNPGNPVCVEVQLDCTGNADCNTFANEQAWHLFTLFNNSPLPGTPVYLKTDAACPPPNGFDQNIFLSYDPTVDPLPKSGSGGNSCFVFGYFGNNETNSFVFVPGYASKFFSPVANPPVVNNVNAGNAVPFIWQEFDLNNNLVTNNPIFFTGGLCTTSPVSGCPANSVAVQFIRTSCTTGQEFVFMSAGSSGLQFNSTTNTFKISAKTLKSFAGTCAIGEVIVTGSGGLQSTHTAFFQFH